MEHSPMPGGDILQVGPHELANQWIWSLQGAKHQEDAAAVGCKSMQ
jgi:hypothetical protein